MTRSEHIFNVARDIVKEMPGYQTMSMQEIHQRVTWVQLQLLRAFLDMPPATNNKEDSK